MRARFTVLLTPQDGGDFPTNADIEGWLEQRGYAAEGITNEFASDDARRQRYIELADEFTVQMPEFRGNEHQYTIFYGVLPGLTQFFVTRRSRGQLTFRLYQVEPLELRSATREIIRVILEIPMMGRQLRLYKNIVEIYEKGEEEVLMWGKIITDPWAETRRQNSLERGFTRISLLLFALSIVVLLVMYVYVDPMSNPLSQLAIGTVERLSTAFLTSAIVSGYGLYHSYQQMKQHGLINWDFVPLGSLDD
jgi:hypothetical protein